MSGNGWSTNPTGVYVASAIVPLGLRRHAYSYNYWASGTVVGSTYYMEGQTAVPGTVL